MACELLKSIAGSCCCTREEIDWLWAEEAERRIDELNLGKIQVISSEQVFGESRERLGK